MPSRIAAPALFSLTVGRSGLLATATIADAQEKAAPELDHFKRYFTRGQLVMGRVTVT
jgi:hypothetical protein